MSNGVEPSKESQVSIQCKRLAELSTELHAGLQGLEKRLEPILAVAPPPPTKEEEAVQQPLCPVAAALRVVADSLTSQVQDVRTLIDRIEV